MKIKKKTKIALCINKINIDYQIKIENHKNMQINLLRIQSFMYLIKYLKDNVINFF